MEPTTTPEPTPETAPLTASDLIAHFRNEEETFTVQMDTFSVQVRLLKNARDIVEIEKAARKFATMLAERPAEALKAYKSIGYEAARMAHFIKSVVVFPAFSHAQALQLMDECGPAGIRLYGEIETRLQEDGGIKMVKEIDEAGED